MEGIYIISYRTRVPSLVKKTTNQGGGVLNLDATGLICDLSVQPRHIAKYMCIVITVVLISSPPRGQNQISQNQAFFCPLKGDQIMTAA